MKTIYLISDHRGGEFRENIKNWLETNGFVAKDLGPLEESDSVDYPMQGQKLAETVVANPDSLGVALCGSGIGISIAANKVTGARCVLANSMELAKSGREHAGGNILAMGTSTQFFDSWEDILKTFLDTPLDPAERHERRRQQLGQM